MIYRAKKPILLFLLTAFVLTFASCRSMKEPFVVTIDDKNLYLNDFLYDIYLVELDGIRIEPGDPDDSGNSYWDYSYQGTTMRQIAKNSVLAEVVMDYILSDQAGKNGWSLTDRELTEDESFVDNILHASSPGTPDPVKLTREVLITAYHRKALADKYHKDLTNKFPIDEVKIRDSIDIEDYREYKTECLFIPTVKTEDKKLVPLSKEEAAQAYAMITEAQESLSEGAGFDTLVNRFPDFAYYTRDFIYEESSCEAEYQSAAIKLQNSSYSNPVKTKYGYYIIHMLDNFSTTRYEQAVEEAIEEEKDKQFKKMYDRIKSDYDITINFDYWDTITIGSITLAKDETK